MQSSIMRYIAAYMLASMNSEGTTPNADSIKSILGSVGVEADDTQLELIIRLFSNITPQMAIEEGECVVKLQYSWWSYMKI